MNKCFDVNHFLQVLKLMPEFYQFQQLSPSLVFVSFIGFENEISFKRNLIQPSSNKFPLITRQELKYLKLLALEQNIPHSLRYFKDEKMKQ